LDEKEEREGKELKSGDSTVEGIKLIGPEAEESKTEEVPNIHQLRLKRTRVVCPPNFRRAVRAVLIDL
jgi:hypothetical protein